MSTLLLAAWQPKAHVQQIAKFNFFDVPLVNCIKFTCLCSGLYYLIKYLIIRLHYYYRLSQLRSRAWSAASESSQLILVTTCQIRMYRENVQHANEFNRGVKQRVKERVLLNKIQHPLSTSKADENWMRSCERRLYNISCKRPWIRRSSPFYRSQSGPKMSCKVSTRDYLDRCETHVNSNQTMYNPSWFPLLTKKKKNKHMNGKWSESFGHCRLHRQCRLSTTSRRPRLLGLSLRLFWSRLSLPLMWLRSETVGPEEQSSFTPVLSLYFIKYYLREFFNPASHWYHTICYYLFFY
jgi:hypothetical protein